MNILQAFKQRFKTAGELKDEPSFLLIPCMNCQEFIQSNLTDNHARVCTQVAKNIDHLDKSSTLFEENAFRLQKIRISLNEKKNNAIALRLCRIIELVTQITTIGNVEISCCQTYLNELQQLYYIPKQSLNLALYVERIQTLIEQKITLMVNELSNLTNQETQIKQSSHIMKNSTNQETFSSKNSGCRMQNSNISQQSQASYFTKEQLVEQINQKIQECNSLKQEQRIYNNLINLSLQKNKGAKWMNIDQNVAFMPRPAHKKIPTNQFQRQNIKSEILTNMSSCDVGASQEIQGQPPDSQTQRLFYSKLLKLKLQTPKISIGQQQPSASALWQQAQQLRLHQDQWEDFLKTTIANKNQLSGQKSFFAKR